MDEKERESVSFATRMTALERVVSDLESGKWSGRPRARKFGSDQQGIIDELRGRGRFPGRILSCTGNDQHHTDRHPPTTNTSERSAHHVKLLQSSFVIKDEVLSVNLCGESELNHRGH